MSEYITLGKIAAAHGIKGDAKVFLLTDFPQVRFKKGQVVELFDSLTQSLKLVTCQSYRIVGRFALMNFKEIDSREECEKYRNYFLRIEEAQLHKLPKDTYYKKDLIGCKVYENQVLIGEVIKVESNGKQDILRVEKSNGKSVLILLVKHFIKNISIQDKVIEINSIEGLLE